jgi:hypothetical protein
MATFHTSIPPRQREYIAIDHPIVFRYFVQQQLVAVASHFLFDEDHIAAPGVVMHPDFRRGDFGKAMSSAAVQSAVDREWIVEWSPTATNLSSLGIAHGLGFSEYAAEPELLITADRRGVNHRSKARSRRAVARLISGVGHRMA